MKSSPALSFSAKVWTFPGPLENQVCYSSCVDQNIAAADFDSLGRDPLVGRGLLQMFSGGPETGDCIPRVG